MCTVHIDKLRAWKVRRGFLLALFPTCVFVYLVPTSLPDVLIYFVLTLVLTSESSSDVLWIEDCSCPSCIGGREGKIEACS